MNSFNEEFDRSSWFAPRGPTEGISHYVGVIRERGRLIGACVLVVTIVAAAYAALAPKTYKAESHLLITPVNTANNIIGLGLITQTNNPGGDIATAASLVSTPEVAALVAARVGNATPQEMLKAVSAVPVAQSSVVAITASASTGSRAQIIANGFANATVQNRTERLHSELDAIIPTLRAQLQALPAAQRVGPGSLGERVATAQALRAAPDPTITVASLAQRPTGPSWPKKKLSIIAGVLVGLVIGLAAAFALEGLDPRVRREEALRRIFRLPVLARIPRERRMGGRGIPLWPADISATASESYRMLRVALGIRGEATGFRSFMITGSAASEGKSTVALNLAATLAIAGHRVILVEADLRRPSLAGAVDLMPKRGKRGTAGVLMGEVALKDAIVPVTRLTDNLSVLLAEQAAPFLADRLLAASDFIVDQAEALAEFVVFDAPPVTEVSDALPLCQQVDEVLVVVRLGHSRTDQLVNLGEVLSRQSVRPSGLVIVGDEVSHGGYYYAAPTGAASNGLGSRLRDRIPVMRA